MLWPMSLHSYSCCFRYDTCSSCKYWKDSNPDAQRAAICMCTLKEIIDFDRSVLLCSTCINSPYFGYAAHRSMHFVTWALKGLQSSTISCFGSLCCHLIGSTAQMSRLPTRIRIHFQVSAWPVRGKRPYHKADLGSDVNWSWRQNLTFGTTRFYDATLHRHRIHRLFKDLQALSSSIAKRSFEIAFKAYCWRELDMFVPGKNLHQTGLVV